MCDGRTSGSARRAVTPASAVRFVLLMTLMADAGYAEVVGHPGRRSAGGAVAVALAVHPYLRVLLATGAPGVEILFRLPPDEQSGVTTAAVTSGGVRPVVGGQAETIALVDNQMGVSWWFGC
jgi:hypothetical protein